MVEPLVSEGVDLDKLLAGIEQEHGDRASILYQDSVRRGGVGGFFAREVHRVVYRVEQPVAADEGAGPSNGVAANSAPPATSGSTSTGVDAGADWLADFLDGNDARQAPGASASGSSEPLTYDRASIRAAARTVLGAPAGDPTGPDCVLPTSAERESAGDVVQRAAAHSELAPAPLLTELATEQSSSSAFAKLLLSVAAEQAASALPADPAEANEFVPGLIVSTIDAVPPAVAEPVRELAAAAKLASAAAHPVEVPSVAPAPFAAELASVAARPVELPPVAAAPVAAKLASVATPPVELPPVAAELASVAAPRAQAGLWSGAPTPAVITAPASRGAHAAPEQVDPPAPEPRTVTARSAASVTRIEAGRLIAQRQGLTGDVTAQRAALARERHDLISRLTTVGIPAHLTDELGAASAYEALEDLISVLPDAPPVPRRAGDVLVVVGELSHALRGAQSVAREMRVRDTAIWVADLESHPVLTMGAAIGGADRTISNVRQAARLRLDMGRADTPTIVVVGTDSADAGPDDLWTAEIISALEPHSVWACVDATRKAPDTAAALDRLGQIDALILHSAQRSSTPAAAWTFNLPISILDGRPANSFVWSALLLEAMAKCHPAPPSTAAAQPAVEATVTVERGRRARHSAAR